MIMWRNSSPVKAKHVVSFAAEKLHFLEVPGGVSIASDVRVQGQEF